MERLYIRGICQGMDNRVHPFLLLRKLVEIVACQFDKDIF